MTVFGLFRKRLPRREVQQILERLRNRGTSRDERKEQLSDLLEIYQRFPALICKRRFVIHEWATPLNFLLILDFDFQTIKCLIQICPQPKVLLKKHNDNGYAPLQLACRHSSATDVIEYLINESPSSIYETPEFYASPFHCALLNVSCTVQTKLKLLHGSSWNLTDWLAAWYTALGSRQPTEILDVLLKELPESLSEVKFHPGYLCDLDKNGSDHWSPKPLSIDQATSVIKLFQRSPRLRTFTFDQDWECGAFLYLMESLQQVNRNLSKLTFFKLPPLQRCRDTDERQSVLQALQSFLERNTSVTNFSLSLRGRDVKIWQLWSQAIDRGLEVNQTLQSVRFDNRYSSDHNPPGKEKRSSVLYWEKLDDVKAATIVPTNRKRYLLLNRFKPSDQCLAERLEYAPDNLDALEVKGWLTSNLPSWRRVRLLKMAPEPTFQIGKFLNRVGTLTALKITNCYFDAVPIFEAIKTHPRLRRFEADYRFLVPLENPLLQSVIQIPSVKTACLDMVRHNMIIEECSPWKTTSLTIQYYLDFNRFGRAKVSTNPGDLSELVELLVTIHDPTSWDQDIDRSGLPGSQEQEKLHTSIIYGLLREVPGTWCR